MTVKADNPCDWATWAGNNDAAQPPRAGNTDVAQPPLDCGGNQRKAGAHVDGQVRRLAALEVDVAARGHHGGIVRTQDRRRDRYRHGRPARQPLP